MKIKIILLWVLLLGLIGGGNAYAVSLSLGGSGPEGATVRSDNTRALYGSDASGKPVLLTEVDAEAPGGGFFTELGVPSMLPDGHVLFGGSVIGDGDKEHWDVFVGDANAPFDARVRQALAIKQQSKDCIVKFKGDPYPVGDENGAIAFMEPEAGGHDALFLYSAGTLSCVARSGEATTNGHVLSVLGFGTAQMGGRSQVVFEAWLKGDKQALLVGSLKEGVKELAVEDELGPNRTRYKHPFGLPSALASPDGVMAAFTTKTLSGSALFLYRDEHMARVLPTGTLTPLGPVSYVSSGRPGLRTDGTVAVLVGCARVPAILRVVRGRADIPLQRGMMTPYGTALVSLGDPALTSSGTMYLGAIDTEDQEKLYVLSDGDALFEAGYPRIYNLAFEASAGPHSIFTGTLTVNQRGDYAYLGGK